jgi:hypothetical protein
MLGMTGDKSAVPTSVPTVRRGTRVVSSTIVGGDTVASDHNKVEWTTKYQ